MKEIIVRTQKELDALPLKFDEFTCVRIISTELIIMSVLRKNSRAELWGNSSAVLWGNSSADAFDFSTAVLFSFLALRMFKFSHAILMCKSGKIEKKSKCAILIDRSRCVLTYSKKEFLELCEKEDKKIVLYKVVRQDLCDHRTGKICYKIGKEIACPDFKNDESIECGNGLHLSRTILEAQSYHQGRKLKCLVDPIDIVVYGKCITKVRYKKVFVKEEIL